MDGDPYFCYMMINLQPLQKTNTFIEVSCDPFKTVENHNNSAIKSTQPAAPNWILDMIIGPFDQIQKASLFVKLWRDKSRGINSRRKRGIKLACDQKLTCWDRSFTKKLIS